MRSLLNLPSYLPVIVLALASGAHAVAHAVAQAANFTPSNFNLLYAAVESRGTNRPLLGYVADALRMPVDDLMDYRQVIAQGHTIVGFEYQSHPYLVLLSRSGTDHWLFLINDAGNSAVTLDSVVPDGSHIPTWHTLTPSDAQPLVAAEEAYWLK
jgi:hypothetical protein